MPRQQPNLRPPIKLPEIPREKIGQLPDLERHFRQHFGEEGRTLARTVGQIERHICSSAYREPQNQRIVASRIKDAFSASFPTLQGQRLVGFVNDVWGDNTFRRILLHTAKSFIKDRHERHSLVLCLYAGALDPPPRAFGFLPAPCDQIFEQHRPSLLEPRPDVVAEVVSRIADILLQTCLPTTEAQPQHPWRQALLKGDQGRRSTTLKR